MTVSASALQVGQMMRRSQDSDPQQILAILASTIEGIGGHNSILYLVDYDQHQLRPYLPPTEGGLTEMLEATAIEATMPGKAFSTGRSLVAERDDEFDVWIPLIERTERIGCLSFTLPDWNDELETTCLELGASVAQLVTTGAQYTDQIVKLRRRRDMTLAAEIQWNLLPPLALSFDGVHIAGILEPAYEVGGDCFDYSLNGTWIDFAIFDSMGHGLHSAMLASLTVASYRNARRSKSEFDLAELVSFIDRQLASYTGGEQFVTACIGRLNTSTGELSWVSAGHPLPLHIRDRSLVQHDGTEYISPLGLGHLSELSNIPIRNTSLQPGDSLLLFTDGVSDARDVDGNDLGPEMLFEQLQREKASGLNPEEVLRRIAHNLLADKDVSLRDDASLLYLDWTPGNYEA